MVGPTAYQKDEAQLPKPIKKTNELPNQFEHKNSPGHSLMNARVASLLTGESSLVWACGGWDGLWHEANGFCALALESERGLR